MIRFGCPIGLALGLSASGCGLVDDCTERGCVEGLRVALRRSDDRPAAVEALRVTLEQELVSCTVSGASVQCDDRRLTFGLHEDADCTERDLGELVSLECQPNGKYQWILFVRDTPAEIGVEVDYARRTDRFAWSPEYQPEFPNGPNCEPQCLRSVRELTLGN